MPGATSSFLLLEAMGSKKFNFVHLTVKTDLRRKLPGRLWAALAVHHTNQDPIATALETEINQTKD